jgi:hypothetical protein
MTTELRWVIAPGSAFVNLDRQCHFLFFSSLFFQSGGEYTDATEPMRVVG